MRLYLDSSALAKRYLEESGTARVIALCAEADEIFLSVLCIPECVSAFNRLKREGRLTAKRYQDLKRDFLLDIDQATMVAISPEVLAAAVRCLEQASLRTLDAIHVASGLDQACDLFLTSDQRQFEVARQMKLRAEWIA